MIEEKEYLCPISFSTMNDPYIVASCGHSFEKKNIYDWVKINRNCPVCKRKAELSDLIPNFALKTIIQKKKEEVRATQITTQVNQGRPLIQSSASQDYPPLPGQSRPAGPGGVNHPQGFPQFPVQQTYTGYQQPGYSREVQHGQTNPGGMHSGQ